jgi:transposase
MSRRREAPVGFECPYRHNCPHLDHRSTTWTLEVYQESFKLREQYYVMEQRYQQRIAELEQEILRQIEWTTPAITVPASVAFCKKLKRFASRMCKLGRQLREKKLKRSKARTLIPALQRQLKRFADRPLDYAPAETLRDRLMNKDSDKLFTLLRVPGVEPTNNHAERSLRCLVIMRKICFGTRSAAGSESHSVLPSLLATARRQGKDSIGFLVSLLTQPSATARTALYADSS